MIYTKNFDLDVFINIQNPDFRIQEHDFRMLNNFEFEVFEFKNSDLLISWGQRFTPQLFRSRFVDLQIEEFNFLRHELRISSFEFDTCGSKALTVVDTMAPGC